LQAPRFIVRQRAAKTQRWRSESLLLGAACEVDFHSLANYRGNALLTPARREFQESGAVLGLELNGDPPRSIMQ
jgi:hypothetical protein